MILLLFLALVLTTASLSPAAYDTHSLENTEGNTPTTTYPLVNLICIRNYSLMHYTGSNTNVQHYSHTLIGTTAQYEYQKFEWILQSEGNNRYSIRYASNINLLLTYTTASNGVSTVCIENVAGSLQLKHLWTFDYTSGQDIIGNSTASKIRNVGNGGYLFASDDSNLRLYSDWSDSDSNAVLWFVENSFHEEIPTATSFNISYNTWVDINQSSTFRVTARPSNAYRCTFPDDFEISIKNPSIVSFNSTYTSLIGHASGSTFITIKHKYSNLCQRIPVTVGQIIPDGTYYISNRASGRFMEHTDGGIDNGVAIQETTLGMATYQIWQIKYEGNGFYSIKSTMCDKYISLGIPVPITGININLSSILNDSSLWRIVQTTQGAYSFLSKYGHQDKYAICSQDSSVDGQDLSQLKYNDDCIYYDEWYITNINSLYSPNAGIVLNDNYTICNIASSRYLCVSNNSVSTSIGKYSWLIDSQYPQSSYFQSRLKDETGLFLSFEGTNMALNTDSEQYLTIKRFNAKPYDGTYVIVYNGMFLCEDPATHEVTLTPYFSPLCLWSFKTADDKTAHFFYFTNFTEGSYPTVSELLISKDYTVIPQANKTASDAYNCLPSTDIFIFRGHGGYGAISFGNTSLDTYGGNYSITRYGSNVLSNIDMAFYLGCSTGVTPSDLPNNVNLPNILVVTYDKGAHFAIGTYDTVITPDGNHFLNQVMSQLAMGKNLKEAIKTAQDSFMEYCQSNNSDGVFLESYGITQLYYPIIYVGDVYQKL